MFAAKAQVKQVERNLDEATKNRVMAFYWFNFLLNQYSDNAIVTETLNIFLIPI